MPFTKDDPIATHDKFGNPVLRTPAEFEWVSVAAMRSNTPKASRTPSQRNIIVHHVAAIAANFNPMAFTPVIVNIRDGVYWIIDGQQHVEALMGLGYENVRVPCWVYRDLTVRQEADLFNSLNYRKAVRAIEAHKTKVTAGYPAAAAVEGIVKDLGLEVKEGSKGNGTLRAVAALYAVHKKHGPEVLHRTLRILRDALPHDPDAFEAPLVKGMGLMLGYYGDDVDDKRLSAQLFDLPRGVKDIMGPAMTTKETSRVGLDSGVAKALVDEVYNKGLRGRRKLDPFPLKARR